MARVDSGNETLFSDDSPCDLATTPSASSGVGSASSTATINHNNNGLPTDENIAPPKITPFSGVLGKGKVVIRPIAFKPVGMMSSRFSNAGERYGSTPVLARPGSQLTLYGSSTDLRHHHGTSSNYSLDRKLLSAASSPPLAMSSLSSLPINPTRKLHGYDSMDNVSQCKSPVSTSSRNTSHCNLSTKNKSSSFRMIPNAESSCSLLDLTPSPSDSGVAELEAALRERDSELVYLRQTMEHNEQAIIRVYQEKERAWERDKRRVKAVNDNRLRASAQKVLKLEQMLMMQTYQLQQEKQRLREEADRAARESTELRQEVDLLRGRLEETEWGLCQKTGEMSLLKAQLKDSRGEQTTKGQEVVQLRNQVRDMKTELDRRENEVNRISRESEDKLSELEQMKVDLQRLKSEHEQCRKIRQEDQTEIEELKEEVITLRREVVDVCHVLKEEQDEKTKCLEEVVRLNKELDDERVEKSVGKKWNGHWNEVDDVDKLKSQIQVLKSKTEYTSSTDDVKQLKQELDKLSNQVLSERTEFEQERITWAQEKEKVLRYQRQLQLNYVQMFRRTRTLEAEVESLTMELELETKSKGLRNPKKNVPQIEMTTTIDI